MTKQHTPLLRSFAFIVVAFALCDTLILASSQTSDNRLPAAHPKAPKPNCIPPPDFQTRVKHLAFGAGRGIFFLTSYNIDDYALINNQGMGYLFQGLTSDNRYYISALFPVRAQFLPKDRSVEEVRGFDPLKEYRPGDKTFKKKYAAYRASVLKKLRALSADKYDPDLTLFEKLVGSLKIENQH